MEKVKKRTFKEDRQKRRVRIFSMPDSRTVVIIAYANNEKQLHFYQRIAGSTYNKRYSVESYLAKRGFIELPECFHDILSPSYNN